MTALAATSFEVWSTTARLVLAEGSQLGPASEILTEEIDRFDRACSRFRDDSELSRLNSGPHERPVRVGPVLRDAVGAALRAARLTGGLVDPTVGGALELLGYDRDFPSVPADGPPLALVAAAVPGWRAVRLDRVASTVTLRAGVRLDLGATAKALCADRAAAAVSAELGTGCLVSLGGDISVAGRPPEQGWAVRIADHHAVALEAPGPVVAIRSGGLATSSTSARRWRRGGRQMHHLVDPRTSRPTGERWRTVSVAAASCLDANIAATAAVVMGRRAPDWLLEGGLPGRLVASDGRVRYVGGWPAGHEAAACS